MRACGPFCEDCNPRPLTHEERQREVIRQFKAAAQRFIDKVESGRARSTETYAELQAALEQAKEWGV